MKKFYRAFAPLALLAAALAVNGCTTLVITEGAKSAFQDRKAEDQVVDVKIALGAHKRLAERDKNLLLDVNVDVWEQRFMLTGVLDSAAERSAVVALARQDKRIKAFYDQIQIVTAAEKAQRRTQAKTKDDSQKSGVGQAVNDFWIETKIKAKLLTTRGITSVNYYWRSVRNKIYLIGRARTAAERDRVLELIRWTDGVKGVKHFVVVKPKAAGS